VTARRAPAGPLPAYVLHSHDWSETSLIVELFIRERGRVVVVAKGAKRPYSQQRSVLLPFQRLLVQLGRTPADEAAEVPQATDAVLGNGGLAWHFGSPGGCSVGSGGDRTRRSRTTHAKPWSLFLTKTYTKAIH